MTQKGVYNVKKLCLKCCNLALERSRYCKEHQPKKTKTTQQEKEYRKMKNKIYSSKKWKKLRQIIFERDMFTCRFCGAKAEEVHHIISICEDESKVFEKENLVAICRDCHINFHREGKPKKNLSTKTQRHN